jgi:hypothetical protein
VEHPADGLEQVPVLVDRVRPDERPRFPAGNNVIKLFMAVIYESLNKQVCLSVEGLLAYYENSKTMDVNFL